MREQTAVIAPPVLSGVDLKQILLFFDRIAVPQFTEYSSGEDTKIPPDLLASIRWLLDRGIVFEPAQPNETWLNGSSPKAMAKAMNKEARWDPSVPDKVDAKQLDQLQAFFSEMARRQIVRYSYLTRIWGMWVAENTQHEVIPIVPSFDYPKIDDTSPETMAIHAAIKLLPVPSENTPLEQLLDFRTDPDSRYKLEKLRHWLRHVARDLKSAREIDDELQWYLRDYEEHLRLHKLKYRRSVLEVLVVTTAQVLEDLAKFKWSKLAERFFELRRRRINLLEAERSLPGAEVAYLADARKAFLGQST